MKFRLSCLWTALLCGTTLHAQTATQPNEGLILTHDAVANPTQPFSLKWHGDSNVFYFILQATSLTEGDWTYFPYAVIGANGIEGVDFDNNSNQLFLRLYYTSDTNDAPYIVDQDGDGISGGDELVNGTDPFVAPDITDSDNDGLPDYWEMYYFGDLSRDGTGDYDNDGISDALEWQAKTNPTVDQANQHNADAIGLRRYTYDSVGRINAATGPVKLTYVFDDEGNLESAQ